MKLNRSAGILLHITSLPSPFGIGDLGPAATAFAEFLKRAGQTYWQLLPLNPTEAGQGHSPYSAISSRAGNTLLISPELMAMEGWLDNDELLTHHLPEASKVDYAKALQLKSLLFQKGWTAFKKNKKDSHHKAFQDFCSKEFSWLHDFALYILIKEKSDCKPWFQWDEPYKNRDEKALQMLEKENKDALLKTKWLQFVFSKQWHQLRDCCNSMGILFFGDLPFYTSYDSADVWSCRELFSLDASGNMTGVAGVPPDAFSSDGQLWGMPVFLWDVHKASGYDWWIDRLKKNIELFDLLRLDHFRAFADYWQVAAGQETAKTGEWMRGPGAGLFNAVKKALGDLPFIAEDLGEINQPVYDLRDEFHFAGMKILQFAFGDNLPDSPYIPHNYSQNFIVYTGTHDNNTVKGWYLNEGRQHHEQLNRYTGRELNQNDIHIVMARMAYASVAGVAILPMQDVLGLDESARMNVPASVENNWLWRMQIWQINEGIEHMLNDWTWLYNRRNIRL